MYVNKERTTLWDIHQKILAACAYRKLPEDDSWLDNFKFLPLAKKQSDDASFIHFERSALQRAAFELLDYAMDCLAQYAVKFNQCRVLGLRVEVTNPALITELSPGSSPRPSNFKACYRGRLTAQQWTLLVRTDSQIVELLLLPAAKALNMSRFVEEFQALITLRPVAENRHFLWRYNDKTYTLPEMGPLFQQAFKQLVEKVYSDMEGDDFLKNPEDTSMTSNGFLLSEHLGQDTIDTTPIPKSFSEQADKLESVTESEAELSYDEVMKMAEQQLNSCQLVIDAFTPEIFPSHLEFGAESSHIEAIGKQSEDSFSIGEYLMEVHECVKACITRLQDKEETILENTVLRGMRAFESGEFEKIESLLKEASSQKQRTELLEGLQTYWSDFAEIDLLLDASSELDLDFDLPSIDQGESSPIRIQKTLDSLMSILLQIGSQAFGELKLEIVRSAYKHVIELRSFQRSFAKLCCPEMNEESAREFLELHAA